MKLVKKITGTIGVDINQCKFKENVEAHAMKFINVDILFKNKMIITLFINSKYVKKFSIENLENANLNFDKGYEKYFKRLFDYEYNIIEILVSFKILEININNMNPDTVNEYITFLFDNPELIKQEINRTEKYFNIKTTSPTETKKKKPINFF